MSSAKTCAQCAAPLPDDAPEGAICAACQAEAQGTLATPSGFQPPTPSRTPSYTLPPAQPQFTAIGDYEVIDKLGQGGMGAVYRARQLSLGRVVALKVLPQQFEEDEDYVARFQREAAVAARLNHPNLVRVYSSGQADGCHFIAMELVEGENLRQRMKREPISMSEALRICADVARALQCGWDQAQLIHRDIKPANIYLSAKGEVKLGDLGLAKSALANTTGITQTGTSLGTPLYMSPEQGRGDRQIDFRSDIYSLGCTLYELLTGKPPYEGRDGLTLIHQHIHAPLPAILKVLPGCPMPLVRLVGRMLKKQPRERHASYQDLIAEMDFVREQIEAGPISTGPSVVVEAWKKVGEIEAAPAASYGLIWAGLALLLVVGAGIAFFVLGKKDDRPAAKAPVAKTQPAATPLPKAGPADAPVAPSKLAGGSAVSSPASTTAATAFPVGRWTKVVFPESMLQDKGATQNAAGEVTVKNVIDVSDFRATNLALRGEFRRVPGTATSDGAENFRINLRFGNEEARGFAPYSGKLLFQVQKAGRFLGIGQLEHAAETARVGDWVPFTVAAVGRLSLASLRNAALLPSDGSSEVLGPGIVRISGACGLRNLEILNLDGLPEADALKLAGTSTVPGEPSSWRDIMSQAPLKDMLARADHNDRGYLLPAGQHLRFPDQPVRSGALRIRATAGTSSLLQLCHFLEVDGSQQGHYRVAISADRTRCVLRHIPKPTTDRDIGSAEIQLTAGNPFEWMLIRAAGKLFVVWNGKLILEAPDPSPLPGKFAIDLAKEATDVRLLKAEYLPLDGIPEADALKLVGVSASPGAKAANAASSDVLTFAGHRYQYFSGSWTRNQAKDYARSLGGHLVTITSAEEQAWLDQTLGPLIPAGHLCRTGLQLNGTSWTWNTGERVSFTAWPPGQPEQDPDIQASLDRHQDPTGNARVRGTLVLQQAADGLRWQTDHEGAQRSLIVEWDDADSASSPPATATKDAPFVNSLGMKFVAVPITGGPTTGKRVLFSIWETRVQDYEVFVKETGREWPKAGFEQGPTHPAVNVSPVAARAFCAWLTERERKAGSLGPGEAYRLPSDHEWSCAFGRDNAPDDAALAPSLKNNRGISPEKKFPWGGDPAPPAGFANYSGEERGLPPGREFIAGWRDHHAATAPVGSYLASATGLFDLVGNVWEINDERYNPTEPALITRGGSFATGAPGRLRANIRSQLSENDRHDDVGFRVVLAPAP